MGHSEEGCCGRAPCPSLLSTGLGLCPLLCPWLPLANKLKGERLEQERRRDQAERILEEETEIRKQKTDHCKYKYLMLRNGIKVLLVEDGSASTSACSLEIKVGNFLDPPHLPGLAHLLEHTIFHASELFPTEGFAHFLGMRGGSSNAFTASTYTNFHFDVPKEHLLDALDRFVSFFICPVFHEKTVENEVEIIQCEHEKNKHSDVWRTNQVERATSNPGHPFSKFSTGTRRTLHVDPKSNKNLKYEVFNFFKRQYSANLMTVCLIHNADLQKLEEIALEKLSLIPNKNVPQTIWRNQVFRRDQMGLKLFIVPVREVYHLNLTFPLEDYDEYYRASPGGYLSNLLGHRGPGSLLSHLKKKGLAHHIVASHKKFFLARFSLMLITIQLTDHGERHVDAIIKTVFQYINMLKKSIPNKPFFDELMALTEQHFELKEREKAVSTAESLAHSLHCYTPREVLTGDYLINEWKPDLINRMLEDLHPKNLRVTVLSKNAKYLETKVEPHYGTEYHIDRISDDLIAQWQAAGSLADLSLPPPNPLISSLPRLVQQEDSRSSPRQPELFVFLDRIRTRSWFMPDLRFLIPRTYVYLKFCSPFTYRSPRECNLNNLLVHTIKDSLSEFTYTALHAGLVHSIKPTKFGFQLTAQGFSEKMPLLISKVVSAIYKLDITEAQLNTVLEVHRKGLQSCLAEPLKNQSKYLLNALLSEKVWTREQRLGAMEAVTLQEVLEFARSLLDSHSLETLYYGNISKAQAREMTDMVVLQRADYLQARAAQLGAEVEVNPNLADWFASDPVERIVNLENCLHSRKRELERERQGPDSTRSPSPGIRFEEEEGTDHDLLVPLASNSVMVHNEHHTMSMLVVFLQLDTTSLEKYCLLEVFAHIVRESIVTKLKHIVILGYVIGCDIRKLNNNTGLRIYVESQFPPTTVNTAIEKCLAEIEDYLRTLNHADFKIHVNALKAVKMESHMKMLDFASMLWREVTESTYDFRRHHRECEHLNFLTLSKVRQFYRGYIQAGGPHRRKLTLSIAPDPTLNTIQDNENTIVSWLERGQLRNRCSQIPDRLDRESLREWLVAVFRSEGDGYQPPGEEVCLEQLREERETHVQFAVPEMDRT